MKPPVRLALRTSDFLAAGLGDRDLRRAAERGELVRVAPGSYVPTSTWDALSSRDRYVVRVHARVERLSGPVAVSHWSAAAVWGMPVPTRWPEVVQITDPGRRSSATSTALHRRPGVLLPPDVVEWEGVRVTTAARTVADLALSSPFEEAVMVLDHALRLELVTRADVASILALRPTARRRVSAASALEFASPLAEWPGESFSRVSMAVQGLAPPELQETFFDHRGKIGVVDFWWPDQGIVGEFDGEWKYTHAAFLKGRTPAQVIRDEKRRQARLDAHRDVRRVVRWDYAVARTPPELARRLLSAGVPRLDPARRPSNRA